jgi:hypothetical protein
VIDSGMAPVSWLPALPQPVRAVMALRARAMDHTLRRAAGDGHVPVNPQMIGSGFFAVGGFHPSSRGCRARAGELAGPVARAVAPSEAVTRRGGAPGPGGHEAAWLPGLGVLIPQAARQRRLRSRPG